MKENGKKYLLLGSSVIGIFVVWTLLIQTIDVQAIGANGTEIGFAALNTWFHGLTGASMVLSIAFKIFQRITEIVKYSKISNYKVNYVYVLIMSSAIIFFVVQRFIACFSM